MRNTSVITNDKMSKHFVENYRFKVLGSEPRNHDKSNEPQTENFVSNVISENANDLAQDETNQPQNFIHENISQEQPINSGFDSNFVEELLKKTDELSSNIIKLQMKIENQEAEFDKRLQAEIARAKEDGINEGLAQANIAYETQLKDLNEKFSSSIAKISAKYDELDTFINKNEEELATTAISIANEVLMNEVGQNSSKIAYNLALNLLKTLSDAKDITLRVNPSDSEYLSENFAQKTHIKIQSDDAISKGGVVIISEAGNIDATLQTRLENIKGLL
ncbi:hypothetical protein LMG7974_00901 [Campylobacter majalis]|uniref:Flagellar assembly protein FliH n=1 Tax=Campylobacter majalis TaxID=2790656 RepID=A0ABM8Q5Y0_9BACT|nr:flagellar assembly protein FliH [Campylobacter majalis]CAD7288222.1 hypothetical protein LMG7974_00901 [Campylobacter majalis]